MMRLMRRRPRPPKECARERPPPPSPASLRRSPALSLSLLLLLASSIILAPAPVALASSSRSPSGRPLLLVVRAPTLGAAAFSPPSLDRLQPRASVGRRRRRSLEQRQSGSRPLDVWATTGLGAVPAASSSASAGRGFGSVPAERTAAASSAGRTSKSRRGRTGKDGGCRYSREEGNDHGRNNAGSSGKGLRRNGVSGVTKSSVVDGSVLPESPSSRDRSYERSYIESKAELPSTTTTSSSIRSTSDGPIAMIDAAPPGESTTSRPKKPGNVRRARALCRRISSDEAAEMMRSRYYSSAGVDAAADDHHINDRGGRREITERSINGSNGEDGNLLVITTDASGGSGRFHGLCAVLRLIDGLASSAATAASVAATADATSDEIIIASKRIRCAQPRTGGRSQRRRSSARSKPSKPSARGGSQRRFGSGTPPEIAAVSLGLRTALEDVPPERRRGSQVLLLTDCERAITYLEGLRTDAWRTDTDSLGRDSRDPLVRVLEELVDDITMSRRDGAGDGHDSCLDDASSAEAVLFVAKVKSVSNTGSDGFFDHAAADLISAWARGKPNNAAAAASTSVGEEESGGADVKGGGSMPDHGCDAVAAKMRVGITTSIVAPRLRESDLDWLGRLDANDEKGNGTSFGSVEGPGFGSVANTGTSSRTTAPGSGLARSREVGRARIERLRERVELEFGMVLPSR